MEQSVPSLFRFHFNQVILSEEFSRFLKYTPVENLLDFLRSAVNVRRQGGKSPNSSVVKKTIQWLANCSYVFQSRTCSNCSVRKYMIDEKTLAAINSKLFKRLAHVNSQLNEVKLVKSPVEQKANLFRNVQLAVFRIENF